MVDGTYLECQDMFRENGIFRDVYLTELDNTYLYDFYIDTKKVDGKYNMTLFADILGDTKGYTLTCELSDNGKILAKEIVDAKRKTSISFEGLDVTEWNAEEPYTYETYITLKNGNKTVSVIRNITALKLSRLRATSIILTICLLNLRA